MAVMGNIGRFNKKLVLKKARGFTLIELVVVMAIIAILAVLIIGAISIARQQSDITRLKSDAHSIQTALEGYYADHRNFPSDFRVDGYSLYAATSTPTTLAGQDSKHPLQSLSGSSYPTPPANNGSKGLICYSVGGTTLQEYWLWMVKPNQVSSEYSCFSGFQKVVSNDADSGIHCPNGGISYVPVCTSRYW